MSNHLIAEANRHAKSLPKMTLPTTKPNDPDLPWYIAECMDLKKHLAIECAAKHEYLRMINELKVKAGFYEQEIARFRADKERLDFLSKTKCAYYYEGPCCWRINEDKATDSQSLRAAIDAARNRSDHIGDINEMMQKGKEAQP